MPGLSTNLAPAKTQLPVRWQIDADEYVSALEVSPSGQHCILGLGNGDVLGLELLSGKELFRIRAHPGGVLSVSWAPACERFLTCGQEPNAKIWSMAGDLCRELPGGGTAFTEHVAWSPKGPRIATAAGRIVRVWSADGDPVVETEPLESTVSGLCWRGDGTGLAAACYGGVHVVPFVEGARARHLKWKGSLISLAWSPDANVIACGTQEASVHFWRLKSGEDSAMSGYPFKPKALAWDSESKLLATSGDAKVTVWDFRGKGPEGTRPIQLSGHRGICTSLAFSPQKGLLATGSQDMSVLLWEPRRGSKPLRFAFLEDEVTVLRWHPMGHTLVGADARGMVVAWEVG